MLLRIGLDFVSWLARSVVVGEFIQSAFSEDDKYLL